jgi:hypothetical protein
MCEVLKISIDRSRSVPRSLRRPAPLLQVPLVARPRNHISTVTKPCGDKLVTTAQADWLDRIGGRLGA